MGHWVANQQIRYGGALAYDTGQYVPPSNVDRHGYDTDHLVTWVDSDVRTDVAQEPHPAGFVQDGWTPVTTGSASTVDAESTQDEPVAAEPEPAVLGDASQHTTGTTADPVPPTEPTDTPETSGDHTETEA